MHSTGPTGIPPWKCDYHRKIDAGLLQPAATYLSDVEMRSCMNGRYRGDGRRTDVYVLPDPLNIDLETP